MPRYVRENRLDLPSRRIILVDDREKNRWDLSDEPRYELKKTRLALGDYTFKGFEDIVCIEKKSGWAEILTDISKPYRERFRAFLDKMSSVDIPLMIIEDTPSGITSACKYGRLTPESLYHWYSLIACEYNIPIMLVGKNKTIKNKLIVKAFQLIEIKITRE